jgi:hypothetical protein
LVPLPTWKTVSLKQACAGIGKEGTELSLIHGRYLRTARLTSCAKLRSVLRMIFRILRTLGGVIRTCAYPFSFLSGIEQC